MWHKISHNWLILWIFMMCYNGKKKNAHLSAGVTYFVPIGLSMSPLNLWLRRRLRTKPLRTNFLPVQRLGSQWPNSHMASGQGSFTWEASAPSSGWKLAEKHSGRGQSVHYDESVHYDASVSTLTQLTYKYSFRVVFFAPFPQWHRCTTNSLLFTYYTLLWHNLTEVVCFHMLNQHICKEHEQANIVSIIKS